MTLVKTTSPAATRAVGAALAPVLRPGDLVLLAGDLGSGKTTLVQGIGEALGVGEPMTSPTFTLVRVYRTNPVIAHADVWRLTRLRELLDLDLDELLEDGAIALVEWGDAVEESFGRDALVVRIERGATEDERTIGFEAHGESFGARLEALAERLGRIPA